MLTSKNHNQISEIINFILCTHILHVFLVILEDSQMSLKLCRRKTYQTIFIAIS